MAGACTRKIKQDTLHTLQSSAMSDGADPPEDQFGVQALP